MINIPALLVGLVFIVAACAFLVWRAESRRKHPEKTIPTAPNLSPVPTDEESAKYLRDIRENATIYRERYVKHSYETMPAEMPPNETLAQRLKRLSLEGHPGGKLGKGTRLGPISFARLPKVSDEPSEE